MSTWAADRLPFRLAERTRIAWTSEEARLAWAPRIARVANAWQEVEIESVRRGVRHCALTILPAFRYFELAARVRPLAVGVLEPLAAAGSYQSFSAARWTAGQRMSLRVAVGPEDSVARLRAAAAAEDVRAIGEFLGYPACCTAEFETACGQGKIVDPTWLAAASPARLVELTPPTATNILLRWVGVRRVPHLPCRFDCAASIRFADCFTEVFQALGFAEELEWIDEMLSWPIEWSALHGIAEIRTPVVKIVTTTDATATRWVVRTRGASYPAEGARGLVFPYTRRAELHRQGPDLHSDNGFTSAAGMQHAHDPLVELAARALAESPGAVLDLGCGNGLLLDRIRRRTGAPATGVERDADRAAKGRLLHPEITWIAGDLFESDWQGDYALALISAARLLERDDARLIARLRRHVRRVLVYHYGDVEADLSAVAHQLGARPLPAFVTPAAIVASL